MYRKIQQPKVWKCLLSIKSKISDTTMNILKFLLFSDKDWVFGYCSGNHLRNQGVSCLSLFLYLMLLANCYCIWKPNKLTREKIQKQCLKKDATLWGMNTSREEWMGQGSVWEWWGKLTGKMLNKLTKDSSKTSRLLHVHKIFYFYIM